MARPKTVAMLREVALSKGEKVLSALERFIDKHSETKDPKMADVWERACDAFLARLGMVAPQPPASIPDPEPTEPDAQEEPPPETPAALMEGLGPTEPLN
jgi:hypothetical protein